MLEKSGFDPLNRLDVVDAGCGTGLCGTFVAPFARRLVGVDLSEKMLAQARDKQVYHALVKGELTEFLRANSDAVDLIVSADALVYFGDLKGVVEAATEALRPNGLFVFTLEHAAGDGDGVDYCLEVHGRYSHSRAYVEQLLMSYDLKPTIVIEAELRMEAGVAVPGLVIRAAKPASARFCSLMGQRGEIP
jgi:predicted TPR repeat methyltransferase